MPETTNQPKNVTTRRRPAKVRVTVTETNEPGSHVFEELQRLVAWSAWRRVNRLPPFDKEPEEGVTP